MASIHWALLLFLVQLPILATSRAHSNGNLTLWCHQDQAAALLQLKQSFSAAAITATLLPSWENGTNCCIWKGISCDASSGLVTVLDLSGHGLNSYGLDPALFSLRSLQRLDLSMNSLGDYSYNIYWHQKFERLSSLTHLNLSNSGLDGPIPIGISKLVNLVSLDLSSHTVFSDDDPISTADSFNHLWEPNFETLVGNLNNLRELYLDKLQIMSSSGEDWGKALAKYVPNLQVLSLSGCGLNGPIHHSLSSLQSLVAINLGSNDVGPIPEFFADFPNLSELQLSHMNLQGWFPQRFFQLKKLRVLDLSSNPNLSGHLPNFPHASSLHTLRLEGTNFSYAKPSSSGDLKLLRELTIDGKFLSMDFLSSFGVLGSLCQLKVNLMDSQNDLGPIFSWIGDLRNLASLDIYRCDFSWTTPSSIGNLKALRSLRMFDCNLPRPILSEIGNLINLQKLEISGMHDCKLHGSVTSSIGNLTNLRSLFMVNCDYCGAIPAAIGYLRNLRRLAIYSCDFTGALPSAVGNLTNLKSMVISFSKLSGPIPYAIGQLKELTQLTIEVGNISGRIPGSLLNLTRLTKLDLFHNHMSGHIPAPLFALPKLSYLNLGQNQLSGPIGEFDAPSSCLQFVVLSRNLLAGQFPKSFFQLSELSGLEINLNNFVDSVDLSSFGRLRKLTALDLSHNKLSVTIDEGNNPLSTSLFGLDELGLACCNITKFPSFLTHVDRMVYLDLSCNKITGDIPNLIWERWSNSLLQLNLSHNMFTGMQHTSYILPFSDYLEVFDLSSNRLRGKLPIPNSSSEYLDYSHNFFSSVLPNFTLYLSHTNYLSMSNNSINGYIPETICDSMLNVLDLSYNNFRGAIPSCLIENAEGAVLNLRENHFEGTLSSNITSKCAFQTIDLHDNNIEGQLPRGLANCSYLEVLDIGNNRIVDTFPSWLGELSNLYVLILRSNQFYGSIDNVIWNHQSGGYFSSLQILDLSLNNFSGKMNSEWFGQLKSMMTNFNGSGDTVRATNLEGMVEYYQDSTEISYKGSDVTFGRILTTLTTIDLSNNRLEGNIPESVGRLVSLRVLNMSHNGFTGKIPTQLGRVTNMESLDLSCNQLSGEIPQELTNLTFLANLNLSDNRLVGKIPQSRQFLTFESNSFEGNLGLCGPPFSKPCSVYFTPPSMALVEKSSDVDVILFLFVGLGLGVGFAAAILMTWGQIGKWFIKLARALRT
ncbi:receptor-like protein 7 [Hordeum vulgare subsp. vulgare]|uniref:Leucine-rich repeat-containing N-terminal plant-type domain-containing protein n=1 Tax=Hordeum vulgare subsp. vulgare TaxID=112509 RepID=A0A8I7B4L8_HORVV|nr:receptor-like protein 7 [Hordeum vulgare subsp. vulgare]